MKTKPPYTFSTSIFGIDDRSNRYLWIVEAGQSVIAAGIALDYQSCHRDSALAMEAWVKSQERPKRSE